MTMTAEKINDLIQFVAIWWECDRTGDTSRRNQVEENIWEVAPRALARKVIDDLYRRAAE